MNQVPRYALNCSILFTELPLLERPAVAKAAGFDAVEFWWPFSEIVPDDHQVEEFVTAIDQAGVDLIALNFTSGDRLMATEGYSLYPAAGPSSATMSMPLSTSAKGSELKPSTCDMGTVWTTWKRQNKTN